MSNDAFSILWPLKSFISRPFMSLLSWALHWPLAFRVWLNSESSTHIPKDSRTDRNNRCFSFFLSFFRVSLVCWLWMDSFPSHFPRSFRKATTHLTVDRNEKQEKAIFAILKMDDDSRFVEFRLSVGRVCIGTTFVLEAYRIRAESDGWER